MRKIFKKFSDKKGSTLIEMMIAFSLFGILITMTISGFNQSLELQQLSMLLLESHDSAGLLFEQITREVRTSETANPSRRISAIDGGSGINFYDQNGTHIIYKLGEIGGEEDGKIMRSGDGGVTFEPVTTDNPKIKIRNFSTEIINSGENYQRLVMSIETVVTDKRGTEYESIIQTSVSPRFYQ